jgi:hypothetical protein
MNFVVATACIKMKNLTIAATINGAYAMLSFRTAVSQWEKASLIYTTAIPSYYQLFGNLIDTVLSQENN